MNLADLLVPKRPALSTTGAERAERAESQQPCGLRNPPSGAEIGGKPTLTPVFRPDPPDGADSETPLLTAFPPNPPNPPGVMQEIENPLPATRAHLATLGLALLPADVALLAWHLPRATSARNQALRAYVHRWRQAMHAEPVEHQKQSRGRFTANTWLRARPMNAKKREANQ